MCLAIPGKLVRWIDDEGPFAKAVIEFEGVSRECQMAFATEANVGDYVLVHAGIAISRIDAEEAERVFAELESMFGDAADEWKEPPA